jgi:hypothetical protein
MFVFFVRRSNDIDHVAPVIWAMARRGHRIQVFSINPYLEIDEDYRLTFLSSLPGVTIGHLYGLAPASRLQAFVGGAMVSKSPVGRAIRRLAVDKEWDFTRRRWFNDAWAERFLSTLNADVLIFDWVKPEQHVVKELLAAAQRLKIPTIALPHGVSITTGRVRTRAAARAGQLPRYDQVFPFDRFVAPHQDHADYFAEGGMPRARIDVLGSARFCDEWIRKSAGVTPVANLSSHDARLKVLFLEKDSFSLDAVRAEASVRLMASLDFARVIVKPQTRNNATRLQPLGKLEIITDIPSTSLVRWADVVIGTVSSILIEPLCVGKPLVYPAHHCAISTVLQEMHACWEVHDDAELVAALRTMADGEASPVRRENVAACLDQIVYAGLPDRDVLGRYVARLEHLKSAARAEKPPVMKAAAR